MIHAAAEGPADNPLMLLKSLLPRHILEEMGMNPFAEVSL
jgi:hypothetical protein